VLKKSPLKSLSQSSIEKSYLAYVPIKPYFRNKITGITITGITTAEYDETPTLEEAIKEANADLIVQTKR
jgi:hypothetical protein